MTICDETGLACNCQPDEGVPCSALNGGLKRMMLDWRAEAIRLQSRLDAQQPAAASAGASCQRCKGVIENCNGDDCDGTGKHQSHWSENEPVFEVGLGWLKDARMYPRGTLLYASPPVAIAAVSDWQPIETAPRDGTYVLASNPASSGAWIAAYQPVAVSGYRFDDPWRSCMLNHYHLDAAGRYLTPTHWKPLPTPPGTAVATAQQSEAPPSDFLSAAATFDKDDQIAAMLAVTQRRLRLRFGAAGEATERGSAA